MRPSSRGDILYVGTLIPHTGGSAIVGSLVLVGLAQRGYAVRAIAPITAEALGRGDIFAESHAELEISRFLLREFLTDPYRATPEDTHLEMDAVGTLLPKLIDERRPDILIIGRESSLFPVLAVDSASDLPSLLLMHGGALWAIANDLVTQAAAREFLGACGRVDRLVTMAGHWARQLLVLGMSPVSTIPNPVCLEQFRPRPKKRSLLRALDIDESATVILHASNMKPVKRPMDIVDAAEAALAENASLVYLIVGDGPLLPSLKEATLKKGLDRSFRFVGWIDHDRMPDYLNLADIVVMASKHETQALAYLEAQASGLLLLTSDVPGAREIAVDGETAVFFGVGDIADLTSKTLLAAGDAQLRQRIGRQARERVKAHSLDQCVDSYAAVIDSVIAEAGPRRGRRPT